MNRNDNLRMLKPLRPFTLQRDIYVKYLAKEYENNVHLGFSNPKEVLQRPLYSEKCTMWAAMSQHGIIGPFFSEDRQRRTQTVDTESYIEIFQKFWYALWWRKLDREASG